MTPTFHNTTGEAGQALKMAIDSARTQEDKVEAYFRAHPSGHAAGAARIHGTVFGWGHISLRRSERLSLMRPPCSKDLEASGR